MTQQRKLWRSLEKEDGLLKVAQASLPVILRGCHS
jgi:hypothetical protein